MQQTKQSTTRPAKQGISFKSSKFEFGIISKIAHRASAMAAQNGMEYKVLTANMDISACHANGCPLKLDELLAADDFTFAHDVFGIRQHINRSTGQLEDCFLPRTAI